MTMCMFRRVAGVRALAQCRSRAPRPHRRPEQALKLVTERETLTVEVERGMRDGQEVVFFEQGEPMMDGEPGDLKFRLVTRPHPRVPFVRHGDDLAVTVAITLTEALARPRRPTRPPLHPHAPSAAAHGLARARAAAAAGGGGRQVGFRKELPHLDGHTVVLEASGITRPGDVVRVAGEGMPIAAVGEGRFGALVVTYTVQARAPPPALSVREVRGAAERRSRTPRWPAAVPGEAERRAAGRSAGAVREEHVRMIGRAAQARRGLAVGRNARLRVAVVSRAREGP